MIHTLPRAHAFADPFLLFLLVCEIEFIRKISANCLFISRFRQPRCSIACHEQSITEQVTLVSRIHWHNSFSCPLFGNCPHPKDNGLKRRQFESDRTYSFFLFASLAFALSLSISLSPPFVILSNKIADFSDFKSNHIRLVCNHGFQSLAIKIWSFANL